VRLTAAQIEVLGSISGLVSADPGDPRESAGRRTLSVMPSMRKRQGSRGAEGVIEVRVITDDRGDPECYLVDITGGKVRL
jgi:hypothetical protein